MASVQILIGSYDYTPVTLYDTVSVDSNVIITNDTMSLTLQVNPGDKITNTSNGQSVAFSRPICGQEIVWQNPSNYITAPNGSSMPYREFGGVITQVTETNEGPSLIYEIQAKCYTKWLDRHLVSGNFNQAPPESIVRQIVNTYAPSFTTYNVQSTNTTVIPQYFDYRPPSDAIKSIADQLEYGWYVDYFKDVHFYAAETFSSPLPNNTLNADTDLTNYGDLQITENADQQYNKVFLRGFKTRSAAPYILTYTGDGQTSQWSTGYRVSSVKGDVTCVVYPSYSAYAADTSFQNGGKPTAGTSLTIAKDMLDGTPGQGGAKNTAYLHYTQYLLRIPNFNGGVVPSGYCIALRVHYLKDMVFLASDPQAISKTAALEGTDGTYEYSVTDKSLTNSTLSAVQSKGQLLLMKYKFPQITGQFNSYFNSTNSSGWRAGQYFQLVSTKRFGGINKTMFVQRVTKTIVKNDKTGLTTLYAVEFADSPYLL